MINRLVPWLLIFFVTGNAPLDPLNSFAIGADWSLSKAGIFNTSFRELLPDIGMPNIGRVQISPSGKFGYRRVGWQTRIPIPYTFIFDTSEELVGDYYTIKLKEVDLWVAEAMVQMNFGGRFSAFAAISGNILQSALNNWIPETREDAERLLWRQREFLWMEVDLGLVQKVLGPLCVEVGLRFDDFRLVFKEPYEAKTLGGSKISSVNLRAYQAQSRTWLPYLGVGFHSDLLKAFIVGSLFAPSQTSLQTRISASSSQSSGVSCYTIFTTDEPATYIEFNAQYLMKWIPLVSLSLWGKSGWLQVSGRGGVENSCSASPGFSAQPFDEIALTVKRHDIAAGLSLNIIF
ncbi:MAG: hypothetical protein V1897_15860 [Pseudomonadota bacterium]